MFSDTFTQKGALLITACSLHSHNLLRETKKRPDLKQLQLSLPVAIIGMGLFLTASKHVGIHVRGHITPIQEVEAFRPHACTC